MPLIRRPFRSLSPAAVIAFAGLVGAIALSPLRTYETSTALAGLDTDPLGVCTEPLFAGFVTDIQPARMTRPASADAQAIELACVGDVCIDLGALSSQPSAGTPDAESLPDVEDPVPVLVSLAPVPVVPGADGEDAEGGLPLPGPLATPDAPGSPGGSPGGGAGGSGGSGTGGAAEQFVFLPGTNGIVIPPGGPGGTSGGPGGGPGGGSETPGSGTEWPGGGGGPSGGSGGGGPIGTGGPTDGGGDEDEPVLRLAAAPEPPVDVPAPATATLLALGLAFLARARRRHS